VKESNLYTSIVWRGIGDDNKIISTVSTAVVIELKPVTPTPLPLPERLTVTV
jgi:hypothetical protein